MNLPLLPLLACLALLSAFAAPACSAGPPALQGYEEQTLPQEKHPDHPVKYLLLKPEKIEPGKTYPVILFLHGAGERGSDNRAQLKHFPETMSTPERRKKYPAFIIAPQCAANEKWVNVDWSNPTAVAPRGEPNATMQSAIDILQHVLKTEPADPRRVYLTGLSMGGYGAWDLAVRHPDWFAAVVPICGGGDPSRAAALKDVPLWAFHGEADNAVPVARSWQMIEALRKAGGAPKYTEYPGVGHESWVKAYADDSGLLDWMFQQVRPQ